MCAYRFIRLCEFFARYKTNLKPNAVLRQNTRRFSTNQFPLDNIGNLKRDILLYTYTRSKLLKYLPIFGTANFCVWVFYGGFMFVTLRDTPISEFQNKEVLTKSSLWRSINFGDKKLRVVSSLLCLGIGVLTVVVCTVLPSRIIKELTLCKGGKIASIVTYGPFGKTIERKVPLKNLSCITSRQQAKSYIAIKVKPKWFYYLIDCRGNFHHPSLFDYTIGTQTVKPY